MKIERIRVGELECNCYFIDIDGNLLIIDPGDEFDKIKNKIGNRNVVGIIVTHYHFDHVGALKDLLDEYKVNVYDRNNMNEGVNIIDRFRFEVIYTPGHKEDLITIYFREDKCMFCGDLIFRDSIGRCDLPGGDTKEMIESINTIKEYDNDIVIYSGHGDNTTLGYEKKNNVYFLNGEYI